MPMTPDDLAAKRLVEDVAVRFPKDAAWVDAEMRRQGFKPGEAPYIWMEWFSQCTTDAIKAGNFAKAESHLELMSRLLAHAHAPARKCIDVAYVEPLMSNLNQEEKAQGWRLVPENLRELYLAMWGQLPFMSGRSRGR